MCNVGDTGGGKLTEMEPCGSSVGSYMFDLDSTTQADVSLAQQTSRLSGQALMSVPTPATMAAGGGLMLVSSLLGLVANKPRRPNPFAALAKQIDALQREIEKDIKDRRVHERVRDLLGDREGDKALAITTEKVRRDPLKMLLDDQANDPEVLRLIHKFNVDLQTEPKPGYLQAAIDVQAYGDLGLQVSALNFYCSARTGLHSRIRDFLFLYQALMVVNADHGIEGYSKDRVPKHWWEADVLTTPLQASLEEGINFAEPILKELKKQFRARAEHVEAKLKKDKSHVPGADRKYEWEAFSKKHHLDKIDERTVDILLGTPSRMGVIDMWKYSLKHFFGVDRGFTRGHKLAPIRQIPTIWLNKNRTDQILHIAANQGPHIESILDETAKAPPAKHPFVPPLVVPAASPSIGTHTICVVNTTDSQLTLVKQESPEQCMAQPSVPEASNPTANLLQINEHSANPEVWIDPAPRAEMGHGSSSIGIWQYAIMDPRELMIDLGVHDGVITISAEHSWNSAPVVGRASASLVRISTFFTKEPLRTATFRIGKLAMLTIVVVDK